MAEGCLKEASLDGLGISMFFIAPEIIRDKLSLSTCYEDSSLGDEQKEIFIDEYESSSHIYLSSIHNLRSRGWNLVPIGSAERCTTHESNSSFVILSDSPKFWST